jgi:tetratricopeptide (TPR) repeat protein
VYLRKIVEIWERGQRDIDRALGALERAFRLDIKDKEIRDELERVGGEYDRWDRVVEIFLGAIDEFGPIDTAVALHHDAARLRERLGQTDKAEALYDEILRLKSDDEVALAAVEVIFRNQQRWEDLANVLEKRTSAPTEALPLGPDGGPLRSWPTLYEIGLERPVRGDRHAGAACSSRSPTRAGATARRPTPEEVNEMLGAHEALARLYSRVGLWGKVVDSLKRQAELTPTRSGRRALRLQVASVYEKELAVPERATEAYEAILASAPTTRRRCRARSAQRGPQPLRGSAGDPREARRPRHRQGAHRSGRAARQAARDKLNNPRRQPARCASWAADAIADDEMLAALLRNLRPRRPGPRGVARALAADRARAPAGGGRQLQARRRAEPRAVAAEAGRPARPGGGTQ